MSRLIDGDELIEKIYPFVSFGSVDYSELKMIVKSMPTIQPLPHWIPVTERLPEDDTVVLVCGKSGGIYTAIHNNSKTWVRGWWKMNSKNHHCNPTAWMPLPEAYQPKGETE